MTILLDLFLLLCQHYFILHLFLLFQYDPSFGTTSTTVSTVPINWTCFYNCLIIWTCMYQSIDMTIHQDISLLQCQHEL